MLCPSCDNVSLAMTDRQGIEIDYCPKCRGIWLDRGELDRLIERAEQTGAPPAQYAQDHSRHTGDRDHPHRDHPHGYRQKRPKSLLGQLFDF